MVVRWIHDFYVQIAVMVAKRRGIDGEDRLIRVPKYQTRNGQYVPLRNSSFSKRLLWKRTFRPKVFFREIAVIPG
jgi:hypothetical protein